MSELSQISSVIFCKKGLKTLDLENKYLRTELEIKYHNIIKKERGGYIYSGSRGGLSHNIKSDILIFLAKLEHRLMSGICDLIPKKCNRAQHSAINHSSVRFVVVRWASSVTSFCFVAICPISHRLKTD